MLSPVVLFLTLLSLFVVCLKILFEGFILSEASIKSVFNIIVNTTRHVLLYLNPFVAVDFVQLHELEVLSDSPLFFVEVWVDIVIPSLPTLLSDSTGQKGSNLLPFLQAVLSHLFLEDHVLFRCPVAFDLLDSAVLSIVPE